MGSTTELVSIYNKRDLARATRLLENSTTIKHLHPAETCSRNLVRDSLPLLLLIRLEVDCADTQWVFESPLQLLEFL